MGDELAAILGGGRMVLAGVSTDCCVLSTALAAADDGVEVQVVADACAGIDDESHAKALDIMRLYSPLVEVVSLAEAIGQAAGAGAALPRDAMDQVGSGARSRALGALYGLAIGDALGMPTQSLPRAQIVAQYGSAAGRLRAGAAGPSARRRAARGHGHRRHRAGGAAGPPARQGGGPADPAELARQLLAWEDSMRARGSLDLLGPSTRQALGALAAGAEHRRGGQAGTTNGAAMRITPVGVATPSADPGLLVDRVVAASRVTHNTGIALAGAAAVAAAVSAGIDGATVPEASGWRPPRRPTPPRRGHWVAGADVAARITLGGRRWSRGSRRERPRTSCTGWSGPAWPPRNRCPRRSRWSRPARTTPGSPAGSPPRWAATATRSPP